MQSPSPMQSSSPSANMGDDNPQDAFPSGRKKKSDVVNQMHAIIGKVDDGGGGDNKKAAIVIKKKKGGKDRHDASVDAKMRKGKEVVDEVTDEKK